MRKAATRYVTSRIAYRSSNYMWDIQRPFLVTADNAQQTRSPTSASASTGPSCGSLRHLDAAALVWGCPTRRYMPQALKSLSARSLDSQNRPAPHTRQARVGATGAHARARPGFLSQTLAQRPGGRRVLSRPESPHGRHSCSQPTREPCGREASIAKWASSTCLLCATPASATVPLPGANPAMTSLGAFAHGGRITGAIMSRRREDGQHVDILAVGMPLTRHREQGDAGGYAATEISSTSRSMSGYQRLKMVPNSPCLID